MIEKYSLNEKGRDFICADIHGHFHLLEAEMALVSFDKTHDRLFSLGDLIDRGEDSVSTLHWLDQPWFYAIQGNHERILIHAYEQQNTTSWRQWMRCGGQWAEQMSYPQISPYYETLSHLPIAIELELASGCVGLVHAELPDTCDWEHVVRKLESIDPKDVDRDPECSDMLWRKKQARKPATQIAHIRPVKNIEHVFHGHSILSDYRTITNRTFMDLGSYATGLIGFIEAEQFLAEQTLTQLYLNYPVL